MTIIDVQFIEIREDYPSLDAEIRGILLSRAQYGATISDIESDYEKLNGTSFPVKKNITEFLLTVPYVMVYCDENGKRLFNIMPKDKTKHLLELVLHQKPQQQLQQQQEQQQQQRQQIQRDYRQQLQRNSNRINNYNINNSNNNNNLSNNITNYEHYNKRHQSNETLYSYTNNRIPDLQHHQQQQNQRLYHYQQQPQPQQPQQHQQHQPHQSNVTNSNWKILQRFNNNLHEHQYNEAYNNNGDENNCFYRDNCNYFYNRFRNNLQRKSQQASIQENAQYLPNNQKSSLITSCNGNCALQDPNMKIYQQQCQHYNDYNEHYINNHDIKSTITSTTSRDSFHHRYNKRSASPAKNSCTIESYQTDNSYEAHLFDFLLLGDDFLLYMARMELGCKFKKDERILQSGLCVSGQSISAAIKRIHQYNLYDRTIIINIGSVDIMKGRQLIEIQHDFRELINALLEKNAKPILTTLAPLANYGHDEHMKKIVLRFNEYIKREALNRQLIVIDIFTCLVNAKGQTLFDCYQNEPRPVTGTTESYVFWNKIGRQRVLRLIESHLEY